jgi:hypothetical protein
MITILYNAELLYTNNCFMLILNLSASTGYGPRTLENFVFHVTMLSHNQTAFWDIVKLCSSKFKTTSETIEVRFCM